MDHVAAYKAANPGVSHKEALQQARLTYTPVVKPAAGPKKPRGRPRSSSPKAKGPCVGVAQSDCTAPCHWVKASARAAAHCAHNPVRAKKAAPAAKKAATSPAPVPAAKKPRGRPRSASPKPKGPCVGVAQSDCNAPCHWVKASARAAAHCAHNPTGRSKKTPKAKAPRSAAQLAAARANIKKAQAARAAKRSTGAGYGSRGGRQQGARQQRAGWLGELLMMGGPDRV